MKKGITAITASIIVLIIIILVGTITITSHNSMQNANKLVFALEISNIQEEVTKYYKSSIDNEYPVSGNEYTINLSQLTTDVSTQFEGETKDAGGQITVYEIDLTMLGIRDNKYGNKDSSKDIYVLSKETGRVYYLEGVKSGNKTYYTITDDLIDIKERNEKGVEEVASSSPHITTKGAVTKILSSGEKEEYISNIEVTGAETVKYEIGIISEKNAKEYFKNNGKTINGDRIKIKPDSSITLYVENSEGEYEIKYRGYPAIPEGFTVSSIEGEYDVQQGLVIYEGTDAVTDSDSDSNGFVDAQETRNQFVWVPVQDISEFVRRDGYRGGNLQTDVSNGLATEPLINSNLSITNDLTGEYSEHAKMMASVDKYGGFYIARYEAGDESATQNGSKRTGVTIAQTVVIRKNAQVYNYVPWGETITSTAPFTIDEVENVAGAVELARSVYPESVNKDIVSTLIYGVQWDAVMNFMKDIKNPNGTRMDYFIYDSTSMGWHTNNQASGNKERRTGIDIDEKASNKVKNIYDLGGNVADWTMEGRGSRRVWRGGTYLLAGSDYSPSSRNISYPYSYNSQWRIPSSALFNQHIIYMKFFE